MKNLKTLAAVAILVAGSIACDERNKPADPATTEQPVAVSTSETTATEITATTDTTATTATETAAPSTSETAAPAPATTTDGTSAPANPPAQQ